MVDPVGATLGAVALIAPAIQACWAAYVAYRETEAHGKDYRVSVRKLRSQRERLDLLMQLKLGDISLSGERDWDSFCEAVVGELVMIKNRLEECNKLRRLLGPQRTYMPNVKSDTRHSDSNSENTKGREKNGEKDWMRKFFSRDRSTPISSRSGGSSMLSATTSTTTPTLGTSIDSIEIVPPGLSSSRVEGAAAYEEKEAKDIQDAKSRWGKFWWVRLHKADFEKALKIIKSSIDTLWSMIQVKALIDTEFLSRNGVENDLELNNLTSLLERTHAAIRAINHGREDAHVVLGIGLVSNHQSTAERWADQGISFLPGSYVIQMQAHLSVEEGQSRLLLTEVYNFSDTPAANQHGEVISSLKDSISSQYTTQDAEGNFQLIGHIAEDEPPKPAYRIFQDVSAIWAPKGSLSHSLQQAGLRRKNLLTDHTKLASLVVLPYFQCDNSPLATRHPRAEHYRFYDTGTEAEADLTEGDVDPSLPYVFCGFGADTPRPSTRSVGKSVPTDQSVNVSAIGLGLLLFQIGSWSKLEYLSGRNSLETMKLNSLGSMDKVVAHSNMAFAKIVEVCLSLPKEGTKKTAYYEIMKKLEGLVGELRS